jgi:mono/diheme cytochrome c family protein
MAFRWWRSGSLGLLAVLAVACAQPAPATVSGNFGIATLTPLPPLPTIDAGQVQVGREVYQANCAVCHGANAEGAPNWKTPGPDGLFPPPPHDDTGHTWHHPDQLLYEIIRDGFNDPLRPGSALRMPAFGTKLNDSEIHAVVEYFKSLWNEDHRLWQWEVTLNDVSATPAPR